MIEFFVIFVVLLSVIAMMAVGVVFKNKEITGSCGGLANVGVEKACDCDKPCDKRLKLNADLEKQKQTEQKIHLNL